MAIDFDGDGRSDLVQQWKDGSGYLRFILYRSNGDGTFTQSIAPSNNVGFETAGSTGTPGPGLIPRDLNGDGRTDFVQPYEAQSIPRSGFASRSKSGALASLRERRAGWPRRRDPGVSTGRSHRRAANRRPVAPRRISRCNFHLRWSSRRAESYAAPRDLSLCTTCMFGCGCASRVLEHACGEDELERHGARQVWRRLWSPSGRRFPPQDLVARGASLSVPGDGSAACYRSPRFSASFRRRNVSLTYFPFRRTWTLQEPYFGLVIVATRVH